MKLLNLLGSAGRRGLVAGALAVSVFEASTAWGVVVFGTDRPILTGLKDKSNLEFGSTDYQINLFRSADEPDTYINQLNLVLGSGWNAAIPLTGPQTSLTYFDGEFRTYDLGTPLSGEKFLFFNEALSVVGEVPDEVPNGLYNFSVEIVGGTTADATDVLRTLNFQLEVFDRIDFAVTGVSSPDTIAPGQSTTTVMTVQNLMTGRDFVATTIYSFLGDFSNGTDSLNAEAFVGDWFNQPIAPGASRTEPHSRYGAALDTSPGLYTGNMGVYGGLHNGDFFGKGFRPTVTVVPEPASAGLLGGALLALARRTRR